MDDDLTSEGDLTSFQDIEEEERDVVAVETKQGEALVAPVRLSNIVGNNIPEFKFVQRVGYYRDASFAGAFVVLMVCVLSLSATVAHQVLKRHPSEDFPLFFRRVCLIISLVCSVLGMALFDLQFKFNLLHRVGFAVLPVSTGCLFLSGMAFLVLCSSCDFPPFINLCAALLLLLLGVVDILRVNQYKEKLQFTNVLIETVNEILVEIPYLLRIVRVTFVLQCIWIVVWSHVFGEIVYAYKLHAAYSTVLGVIMLFVFYWTMQVLNVVVTVNTVGMVCAKIGLDQHDPIVLKQIYRKVLRRSLTASFGSVCCGALESIVCRLSFIFLRPSQVFEEQVADNRGARLRCHPRAFLKYLIRRINYYGWARVAIVGTSFNTGCKQTWGVFERTGIDQAIDGDVAERIVFFFGAIGGWFALFTSIFVNYLFDMTHQISLWGITTYMLGYFCISLAIQPVNAAVQAMYVCFAENPEAMRGPFPIICHRLSRIAEVRSYTSKLRSDVEDHGEE